MRKPKRIEHDGDGFYCQHCGELLGKFDFEHEKVEELAASDTGLPIHWEHARGPADKTKVEFECPKCRQSSVWPWPI